MEKKTQFTFLLENRPGAVAEVARVLGEAEVNIEAVSINDGVHHGVLRLVVEDREAAREALRGAKLPFSEERVHALRLSNRPGALAEACALLAEKGLNLDFVYGSTCACAEDCACVLIVSVADAKAAAAALESAKQADRADDRGKKKGKGKKEKKAEKRGHK